VVGFSKYPALGEGKVTLKIFGSAL